jgi:pimeloyl-ACP methyl ester carboxylesterase
VSGPRPGRWQVRGLELAYHEWGEASAPLVLCLHGFMDHGLAFAELAEALAARWRVIAVDFRGHGHSGWVGAGGYYHFYDYFHDVDALHAALGRPGLRLLAHSMGGSVASGFAAMRPESVAALVSLEGMGPPAGSLDELPGRLVRFSEAQRAEPMAGDVASRRRARAPMASLDIAAERLRRANPRLDPARARRLAESFTEPTEGGARVWRYDPLHRTPGARPYLLDEVERIWGAIRAPVLSVIGGDSPFRTSDAGRRHRALGGAVRVAEVAGAGHNLHHDHPEAIAALAEWWFDGGVGPIAVDGVRELDLELEPLSPRSPR